MKRKDSEKDAARVLRAKFIKRRSAFEYVLGWMKIGRRAARVLDEVGARKKHGAGFHGATRLLSKCSASFQGTKD